MAVSQKGLNKSADLGKIHTNLRWFMEKDGIVDREFNGGSQSTGFYDTGEHKIWFTNIAGLVSLDPYAFNYTSINKNNFEIQSVITSDSTYRAENKTEITLENTERSVVLKFAHIAVSENLTENLWVKRSDQEEWIKPEVPGLVELNDLSSGITSISFSTSPGGAVIKTMALDIPPTLTERTDIRLLGTLFVLGILYLGIRNWRANSEKPKFDSVPTIDEQKPVESNQPKDLLAEYITEHYKEQDLNVDKIATDLSMSRSSLYRLWNEHHEKSISEYINDLRLDLAVELIRTKEYNITQIAEMTGYSSQSYFTKVFKKQFGTSPSKYIREKVN